MKKYISLIMLLVPVQVSAGAWVNKVGESTLIHNFYYWQFSEYRNSKGITVNTTDFTKYEYKPFYEYGMADGYSIGFSPSFQSIAEDFVVPVTTEDKNEALATIDIFAKARIYQNDEYGFAAAIIPMLELAGIYEEEDSPFFGKKESFFGVALSVGKNIYSIKNNYGFVNLEIGYRGRFTDAFGSDGGGAVKSELIASFPTGSTHNVVIAANHTKSTTGYTSGAASFLQRYGYDATQIEVRDKVKLFDGAIDVEFGYMHQLYARNTGIGSGFKLSVSHRF